MIPFTSVIGIALKLVANREKIAAAWGEIGPIVGRLKEIYPQVKDLIEDIAPGTLPSGPQEGFSVEWLQQSLNTLDNSGLVVDGDYGEATRSAVYEYQQEHPPLVVDGWAGVATQASIYEDLAKHT